MLVDLLTQMLQVREIVGQIRTVIDILWQAA